MKNKYNTGCIGLLWLFFCLSASLYAQEIISVQGRVDGEEGPLVGVTVLIKGTQSATVTDSNGAFKIKAPKGASLLFEFMGYTSQEKEVNSNVMIVKLNQNTESLNEITINTGYYTVKERERTGSIAKISAKDIELSPVVNPLQAIQGRLAGVHITQNTGLAGGGFDIEIRGRNSFRSSGTGANIPLYIIDGVPVSENLVTNNSLLSDNLFQNKISVLNGINPKDIESIEILKDADATAIYGSRGANGVVLITTKKGQAGKTRFTINSSTSFSKVGKFMEMMNTEQFNQMRDEAFENDGITYYPFYEYDMVGTWDRNRYTDWQRELIGGTAISKDIGLGVSGGNDFTRFNVNLAHGENGTVFPQSGKGFVRNSALINLNHRSQDDKWNINVMANYSVSTNDLPSADLTTPALKLPPNAPALYQADGKLNWQNNTFLNPLAGLGKTYDSETRMLVLNTQIGYKITPSTSVKINAGVTTNSIEDRVLEPHTIWPSSLNRTSDLWSVSQKGTNNSDSFIIEPQIHWEKKFRDHSVKALIGGTFQSNSNDLFRITGIGFSSNAFITNIGLAKTKIINQIKGNEYKYAAFFARLNYAYKDKYIVNLTGRRDGSSRFGDNNKFGNFGAVGAAWIFSEEFFAKNWSWLSFGKLRGSYGTTGSDNVGDYMYLDTYTANTALYDGLSGLYPSRLFNPNYSWEKTTKLEVALELGLFNDKINVSLAWYQNRSSNQLLAIKLPEITGFPSISDNFGATIQNRGLELTLNTINIRKKDWNWSTNFNISLPENKLIAFPGLESSTYKNSYVVGKSINLVSTYNYEGVDPATGLYKFTDYDNNNIINTSDKRVFVEREMKFHGGLQNTISYKKFSLDFLFQFVKQTNFNFDNIVTVPGLLSTNYPVEITNRWTATNPNAQYTAATTSNSDAFNQVVTFQESNRAISDASFVRLKNVSLGYQMTFPKLGIELLNLYVQGQNLWTLTNYYGIDPEFTVMGNLPPLRTIAFGMQLTF
ncbi:SusC/RagA family TonB-linked outer membrane protein [Myroides guanonis]|uniref:TonB-linked outer membrane protein, SusC/RagA family n=1 Tax=Myroides guanonis TaxID=1150112 RepID=A0A1I3PPF7_9FLAO|nr:SusC/RagA family TonB-linked outer membrane protein [Myroides guanonis]SFJ23197.1 TonB-linked outer membrane protein, SusC/RagA family [Myroides guanonis]